MLASVDTSSSRLTENFSGAVNTEMRILAQEENSIFVGQSVRYDGARIYDTLSAVPVHKRVEMPVIEDFQMGYCIGLALAGKLPVCIFPRFDFMVLAFNQIVNHLDKIPLMSSYRPKVIIRTTVAGAGSSLHAGPQHTQDHTEALRAMLKTVRIERVETKAEVHRAYEVARTFPLSSIIVEAPC